MKLYLVQHGEAAPKSENAQRPLTKQGCDDVACVAAFSCRAGVKVDQIRHSGKLRAEETARIFSEQLKPARGVIALPGLAPKDDVRPVAEFLNRETESMMFVGHRPFMERLVGLLVTGDKKNRILRFRRGGIVCLVRSPKSWKWEIQWAVTPDLIL
jgi:phosphohistidine phosphatase